MGMKNNGPGCCSCGPYPFAGCSPCRIPEGPLSLSWYYWQIHYGGPTGTTYTAAGPISTALNYVAGNPLNPTSTWSSGWFLGPDDSVTCNTNPAGGNTAGCCWIRFTLTCSQANGTNLQIELSSDPNGVEGYVTNVSGTHHGYGIPACYDGTIDARTGGATYQCSPLLIQYGNTGYVGNLFASGVLTES
jgi:hypothetical protein